MNRVMEVLRQRSLRELLDYCRERTKENIRRYRKKAKWYWPELHLYCGICKLSTGLYIRSIICLVFYIIATVLNILMVYYIVDRGRYLFSMDMTLVEDFFDVNLTEDNFEHAKKIYTLIISYLLVWCAFKIIYILSLVSTIYAMYKKKPKILKIVIFNNTLNWILDIILSLFGAVLTQLFSKALILFCLLFEGYNILALSSEYKQLKGKSKLIMNLPNTNVEVPTPPDVSDQGNVGQNFKHCETCSCNMEPMLPSTSERITTSDIPTAQCTPVDEEKHLNIKDIEIIFNQDQLLEHNSSVLENNRNTRPTRPTVLELEPYDEDIEKKEVPDVPVIYDQNQLNICGSPVIESQEVR